MNNDVLNWSIRRWRIEFKNWMIEQNVWNIYTKINKNFNEIKNKSLFLFNAFIWHDHTERLTMEEWHHLHNEWFLHINKLEGKE